MTKGIDVVAPPEIMSKRRPIYFYMDSASAISSFIF